MSQVPGFVVQLRVHQRRNERKRGNPEANPEGEPVRTPVSLCEHEQPNTGRPSPSAWDLGLQNELLVSSRDIWKALWSMAGLVPVYPDTTVHTACNHHTLGMFPALPWVCLGLNF